MEYAFQPNLSMFLEYDYYDFGTEQVILTPTPNFAFVPNTEPMKIGLQIHTVKVGLNYQFH